MHRCCCYRRTSAGAAAAAPPSASINDPSETKKRSSAPAAPMHRALLFLGLSRRGSRASIDIRAAAASPSASPSPSFSSSSSSSVPFPPPPPLAALSPLPAALARAREKARFQAPSPPLLTLRVAGVSFEGRQEATSALRKAQPLALRRERGNAFDPRAVRVETLDGKERIGYVPRAETDAALPEDADAAFAVVRSVGRAHLKEEEEGVGGGGGGQVEEEEEGEENVDDDDGGKRHRHPPLGPWGVTISMTPGLRPLEIDALPPSIAAAGPLSAALPEAEWRRLAGEAARASGFRCAVTGGVGGGGGGGSGEEDKRNLRSAPVEVHEHWRIDDDARVAVLLGLRALCPEAHDVAHGLSLQSQQARDRATATLRGVNGWGKEDAALYWRGREELAASRGGGADNGEDSSSSPPPSSPWRIDARWLEEQGVDLETLSPAWRDLLLLPPPP